MPLPVALGATSKSSQRLSTPVPHPDDSEDGVALEPLELYQTVAFTACPEHEWSARVSICYYDLVRPNGKRDTTMAELRISIGPLAKNLSPRVRETVHHIRLPDGASDDYLQSQPIVKFSSDRRNLALLLFHPHQQSSAVVVFQLRKPRPSDHLPDIPLPKYVSEHPSLESPAVATHPKLSSAWGVCSICDLPGVFPPVLLCATQAGQLLWMDYKSTLIIASGSLGGGPTVELHAHCRTVNNGTVIAVRPNGAAVVAKWHLVKGDGTLVSNNQVVVPRRASTGAKAIPTFSSTTDSSLKPDLKPSPKKESPAPDRKAPGRSKSSDLIEAFRTRFSPNPKGQQNNNSQPTGMGKTVATRRADLQRDSMRRHMDHFVLHELQSKTNSMLDAPITPQRIRHQRRRTEIAGAAQRDSFQRQMKVTTLSQLYHVQSALFCSSSVFVVLYRPGSLKTSRGYPRAAQAIGICEAEGSLVELAPLELAQDRLENISNFEQEVDLPHLCGLDFDAQTGSLAVNTVYYNNENECKWLACIWNWRSNVVGFMLSGTVRGIFKRFLWSRDYFQGISLCIMEAIEVDPDSNGGCSISMRKHLTPAGVLSPSPSSNLQVHEPSSILLSGSTVSYPVCTRPTAKDIYEIEWKESLLPPEYVHDVGAPVMATVGREHGRVLAIASTSGICILDILRNDKWRLFANETEEKAFHVVAMTWWECSSSSPKTDGDVNEDLLVAIIQMKNGSYFLSCWSPNRLDLAHQLLQPVSETASLSQSNVQWGIALPRESSPVSLSLLADPSRATGRRAVALVSCMSRDSKEVEIMAFRLQTVTNDSADSVVNYTNQKPFSVLSNCASRGTVTSGGRSASPIASIFLASASFRFDLHDARDTDDDGSFLEPMVATVGIVRTPGGLEAAVLTTNGDILSSDVVDGIDVGKFYLADIVNKACDDNLHPAGADSFVWAVQLLDGELFSWTVPYLSHKHSDKEFSSPVIAAGSSAKPKGLDPPELVCKDSDNNPVGLLLGIRCVVGSASDWIEQSTSLNQSDLSLGHVPSSGFGCVLSVGQTSKKFHRTIPGGFDTDAFADDFLDYEIYSQGDFIMGPPAFVPSLFSLFLEAAYLKTEIPVLEETKVDAATEIMSKDEKRLSEIESHIVDRLQNSPNEDAVMMALRLLIIRSVEVLSDSHRKLLKHPTEESHKVFKLTLALYSGIVSIVRNCTTGLQFASLFLEVGRQIEPSCLSHLFPIPVSKESDDSSTSSESEEMVGSEGHSTSTSHPGNFNINKSNASTVTDLFDLSMKEGCLAASTSALPLLSSKLQTRRSCEALIRYSLDEFIINVTSTDNLTFDGTEESRRVLGDIFRFGMKLEEAAALEELGEAMSIASEDSSSGMEDLATLSPDQILERERNRKLMCIGGRNSSILHYLGANMFSSSRKLQAEEEEIKRAATSFIEKEFDEVALHENTNDQRKNISNIFVDDEECLLDSELHGVAAIVGETVVDLYCSSDSAHPWRSILSLAKMLLTESEQELDTLLNDHVADLVEGIQHEDLEALVPSDFERGESDDRADFIMQLIASCSNETTESEASLILDLVFLLLARIEEFPLQEDDEMLALVTAGLAVAGLVAATVSNQISDFLTVLDEGCALVQCFDLVAKNLEAVV